MNDQFLYDVFLSHSSKDKTVVRNLATRLKKDGLCVWFDEWEIKPGDSIPVKIEEGLGHSRVLVLPIRCGEGIIHVHPWLKMLSCVWCVSWLKFLRAEF